MKHQKSLLEKFYKKFRNTTLLNLQSKLYISKQKLKAKSKKLIYKKLYDWKTINWKFSCDPKSVYHTMKGNCITAEKIPTKHEPETFWKNIWQAPDKTFEENSSWLHELEMIYYSDVQTKHRKSLDRDY